jgi:hypothetical protein
VSKTIFLSSGFDSPCTVLIQINSIAKGSVTIFSMSKRQQMHVPLDVKLVAKIGLSVAVASCIGLLLVLLLLSDDNASGYGQVIGAFGIASKSLGPAMLVFGLAMASFAGITAWLFSLYASFRIAGPLYRISRDLELQIEHASIKPMPIRAGDSLQREWKAFEASVAVLHAQHGDLKHVMSEIEVLLQPDGAAAGPDSVALASAIARLKKAEQRVSL